MAKIGGYPPISKSAMQRLNKIQQQGHKKVDEWHDRNPKGVRLTIEEIDAADRYHRTKRFRAIKHSD